MRRIRVIPTLLVSNNRLVKTIKFNKETYIGDPINAIKIFNDKEVDELAVLDIKASIENRAPNFDLIEQFASECFMPLSYGGGIQNIAHIQKIFSLGVEKVILNSIISESPSLITEAVKQYGAQSIVASIDVNKSFLGKHIIVTKSGTKKIKTSINDYVKKVEDSGVGEIFLNTVYNDGMMNGYDIDLIRSIADTVRIPVIACGGASNINDFSKAIVEGHASAVAAGSLFVYNGKHKAVLINYPSQDELTEKIYKTIPQ